MGDRLWRLRRSEDESISRAWSLQFVRPPTSSAAIGVVACCADSFGAPCLIYNTPVIRQSTATRVGAGRSADWDLFLLAVGSTRRPTVLQAERLGTGERRGHPRTVCCCSVSCSGAVATMTTSGRQRRTTRERGGSWWTNASEIGRAGPHSRTDGSRGKRRQIETTDYRRRIARCRPNMQRCSPSSTTIGQISFSRTISRASRLQIARRRDVIRHRRQRPWDVRSGRQDAFKHLNNKSFYRFSRQRLRILCGGYSKDSTATAVRRASTAYQKSSRSQCRSPLAAVTLTCLFIYLGCSTAAWSCRRSSSGRSEVKLQSNGSRMATESQSNHSCNHLFTDYIVTLVDLSIEAHHW